MRLRSKIRKVFLSASYNLAASCLCLLPRKKNRIIAPKSILVIRLGAIGETLLVFPLTKVLKEQFPSCRITVLTLLGPLWRMNPYVDEIVDFSHSGALLRSVTGYRSFDVAIDSEPAGALSAVYARTLGRIAIGFDTTQGRGRLFDYPVQFNDQQYEAQTFLDLLEPLGMEPTFESLVAPVATTGTTFDQAVRSREPDCLHVGINLGASLAAPERLWPPENFAALIRKLHGESRCRFVFFGLKLERRLLDGIRPLLHGIDYVDLTNKLSLEDLVAVLGEMDLLLSADTGTMHLAASLDIPVFSFFGPNLPVRFAPRNSNSRYFYENTSCSPCINVHQGQLGEKVECHGECVKNISVETVAEAIGSYRQCLTKI
jgi:ADP-heptose:LPS heptosyltransferase